MVVFHFFSQTTRPRSIQSEERCPTVNLLNQGSSATINRSKKSKRTTMSSSNSNEISPSPPPFNAPKFGTQIPNRIFVGGIAGSTTEEELYELFSTYGCVKEAKIIADRAGVSKGYGFVTFESEEDAKRTQKEAGSIVLKERKLNIAPAVKKQPFSRVFGSPGAPPERVGTPRQPRGSADWNIVAAATPTDPTPLVPNGTVFYHNGAAYYNPGVVFTPTDATCQFTQPQAYYQMVYSPTPVYIPQQYQPYQTAAAQWTGQPVRWAAQVGSYGQNSIPHISTSSSTSTSTTSQYMYSGTGGGTTTPTTNTGQGTSSIITSTQLHPSLPASSNVGDSSANNTSMAAAAVTYSYPPPSVLAQYQPQQCGAGDVTEQMPIMEATPIEPTGSSPQDSVGPTKPANSSSLGAVVHFVQAWPFPPPTDSDDGHLIATASTTATSYTQGSFNKAYQRKPQYQPGSSPRKVHSYGLLPLPHPNYYCSPQRRVKSRPPTSHHNHYQGYYHQHYGSCTGGPVEAPTVNSVTSDAIGTAAGIKTDAPTNGITNSPLTPPPTPMSTVANGNATTTMVISDTTRHFKGLKL